MLIIRQSDGDRFRGYEGPVIQVDEVDVTVPAMAAATPTDVDVPIGAQRVPVGGVVAGDFADIAAIPDVVVLRRTNDTAGHITLKLFSFAGVIAPVVTRVHYTITIHTLPAVPPFYVG